MGCYFVTANATHSSSEPSDKPLHSTARAGVVGGVRGQSYPWSVDRGCATRSTAAFFTNSQTEPMQTRSFGGSKRRNKVSVGEPAEGSLLDGLLFRNSERNIIRRSLPKIRSSWNMRKDHYWWTNYSATHYSSEPSDEPLHSTARAGLVSGVRGQSYPWLVDRGWATRSAAASKGSRLFFFYELETECKSSRSRCLPDRRGCPSSLLPAT